MIALVLVLAQAGGPVGWANGRPPECANLDGPKASNVWERAKAPQLRKYCDLLASGASKLAGAGAGAQAAFTAALAAADEAEQAMPGRAGAAVLRGRALAKLGRWSEALAALQDAKTKDDRALDEPTALLAYARSLARSGKVADAGEAYRALLPRASSLTPTERGAACLEAGLLAMSRGPSGLDDAIAILRQGTREGQDMTQVVSLLGLSLALDRAGQHDEARAVIGERSFGDPKTLLGEARIKDALGIVAPSESTALLAVALEAHDPVAARDAWKSYVDAKGFWADHARQRENALAGRRGKPK
jgi:tetratricopeptide (TPR) repeat protein